MSLAEVAPQIGRWMEEGRRVALATVMETWGSAPRRPGACMAVGLGEPGSPPAIAGSVSGGCVESAVVELAERVLADGRPQLVDYGVSDDDARAVGLACGGRLRVLVMAAQAGEPWDALASALRYERALTMLVPVPVRGEAGADAERGVWTWSLRLRGDTRGGDAGGGDAGGGDAGGEDAGNGDTRTRDSGSAEAHVQSKPAPDAAHESANEFSPAVRAAIETGLSDGHPRLIEEAGARWALLPCLPADRLYLAGAGHISQALAELAPRLGFRVTVIDPRASFANAERFGEVRLHLGWPDATTLEDLGLDADGYLVALAHDPKIDDPALVAALGAGTRYVGALGSRRSHAERCQRLAAMGIGEDEIARIHAPVGLDIGARTPAEIALSILAEMVRLRNGGS
jgi:xanthine dehydrogenase accessory factor